MNQLDGAGTDVFFYLLPIASGAFSAYHGVKRNEGSVGWGIVWFVLGSLFPVIMPVIGLAQGYAKTKEE